MTSRRSRLGAALTLTVLLAGCAFTRLTDRAFLGVATPRPDHPDRIITGLVLLPIAVAADVVSAPLQLVALAIWGDDYLVPFARRPSPYRAGCHGQTCSWSSLGQAELDGLEAAIASKQARHEPVAGAVFGLTPNGEWVELQVDSEQRAQLLARGQTRGPQP